MIRPETPNLDKRNTNLDEITAVHDFVAWLARTGRHIGRLAEPHEGPCLNFEGQDPEDYSAYDSCYLHLAGPQRCVFDENADALLADFWGINLGQLKTERERLLSWSRSNQAGPVEKTGIFSN